MTLRNTRGARSERGSIILIVALSFTVLLMFVALAVDYTYLMMARHRAQAAADAAAHAGMVAFVRTEGDLVQTETLARAVLTRHGYANAEVEIGGYDFDNRSFGPASRPNAVQVGIPAEDILEGELFLAPHLGLALESRGEDLTAEAAVQPREVMFVLDQSCSMASGAKVASAKEGALLALDAIVDTDPNGQDMAGFVGFGDAAFLHTPLTRVRPNWGALRGQWNREICLCTLDPFVRYYAYYQGKSQTATQVMDLVDGQAKPGHESFHPLETGDSHYGTEGQAELSFRCCEPHCNAGLETSRPEMPNVAFTNWMNTYQHGNGVLWGLQVAAQEYEDNGMGGSHKILIVLGDGADFCPGGTLNAMMPPPCSTGGNLTAETIAYAQTLWEDQRIHIYPVYYGTNGWTRDYYEDLATGEGRMFNPTTPAELEAVFSEIVYRSQIVLVP